MNWGWLKWDYVRVRQMSQPKAEPEKERYSRLTVTFADNSSFYWEVTGLEKETDRAEAWRRFIKWYHGRPQSMSFVMQLTNGGADMVKRVHIKAYSIRYAEREKK